MAYENFHTRLVIKPWGIQVSLIESLRFLLLKAVMIPITKKTLGRLFKGSITGFLPAVDISSFSALADLAAASFISREDMVLSNALKFLWHHNAIGLLSRIKYKNQNLILLYNH